MTEKYMTKPEVVAQLSELIKATDYARLDDYNCLNCHSHVFITESYFGKKLVSGVRGASDEEYKGVLSSIEKLNITKEEINQELKDRNQEELFENGSFHNCYHPNDLCELVASIMDKKGLLKKTQQ